MPIKCLYIVCTHLFSDCNLTKLKKNNRLLYFCSQLCFLLLHPCFFLCCLRLSSPLMLYDHCMNHHPHHTTQMTADHRDPEPPPMAAESLCPPATERDHDPRAQVSSRVDSISVVNDGTILDSISYHTQHCAQSRLQ